MGQDDCSLRIDLIRRYGGGEEASRVHAVTHSPLIASIIGYAVWLIGPSNCAQHSAPSEYRPGNASANHARWVSQSIGRIPSPISASRRHINGNDSMQMAS